jgi:uncharacterized damage-inducible protein DinB
MKHLFFSVSFCICCVVATPAQDRGQSSSSPAQGQAAQAQPAPSVASTADAEVSIIERELVALAEAMPEDKYNYAPTNGEFKGVRTFAVQVRHVATVNSIFWSTSLNEKSPIEMDKSLNGPESIKTKAEIVQLLKDSFALGHRAAKSLTADNMLEQRQLGPRTMTRLFMVTYAVAHGFDHYGQAVEYLRANGIVPPASRASSSQ